MRTCVLRPSLKAWISGRTRGAAAFAGAAAVVLATMPAAAGEVSLAALGIEDAQEPEVVSADQATPPATATDKTNAAAKRLALDHGRLDAGFDVYWGGFRIGLLDLSTELKRDRYALSVRFRTAGMFAMVADGESRGEAEGRLVGDTVKPLRYQTRSLWNDKLRHTELAFENGEARVVDAVPPPSDEREDVPADMRQGLDPLTLALAVARNPGTNGESRREVVYDGVRAVEFTWNCPAQETLPVSAYSTFSGEALRCDVSGRQVGGFHKTMANRNFQLIAPAQVWLAKVGGADGKLFLPVKLSMDTQYGGLMAHLSRLGPPPADGKGS